MDPFLRTVSLTEDSADVELALDVWHWGKQSQQLEMDVSLVPKNFSGRGYHTRLRLTVQPGKNHFGLSGRLQNVRLWWPIDMGDPNLYLLAYELRQDGQPVDRYQVNWGARTIEMMPNADGPNPRRYNFQMRVNGKPFVD